MAKAGGAGGNYRKVLTPHWKRCSIGQHHGYMLRVSKARTANGQTSTKSERYVMKRAIISSVFTGGRVTRSRAYVAIKSSTGKKDSGFVWSHDGRMDRLGWIIL